MTRHRADLVSLFFGLIFVIVAGWWAIAYFLDVHINLDVPNLGWIAAGALILIGLLGVVASLRGDRRPVDPTEPPVQDPAVDPTEPPVQDTAAFEPITVPDVEPVELVDPIDPVERVERVEPLRPYEEPEAPRS